MPVPVSVPVAVLGVPPALVPVLVADPGAVVLVEVPVPVVEVPVVVEVPEPD